ncbi:MAG: hypothetical protein COB24_05020 [Hyphomicrobiales bacterium]|nr:MAG: hypothetical protein COB24_05020 [Hyphomicrobiales bacterium]
MRLFPIIILIIISVIAIKTFSIIFDQNTIVSGVQTAEAAEGDPTEEDDLTDEEKAEIKAEMDKNVKIEEEKQKVKEANPIGDNVDILLHDREKRGTTEFFSDTEIQLLQSLKKRRDMLDERQRKIELQAKLLQATEQQLDSKIARLKALEAVIKDKLGEANEQETNRFTSLVKTYETMKPKEAALILSVLDLAIMEKIARSMSTKKLAPVLARMDLKAARALTIRLAQPPAELTMDKMTLPPETKTNVELPQLSLE